MAVYKLRPRFRVHYLLTAVQSVVAGQHVRDAARQRTVDEILRAEQLNAQNDRRNGTVDRTAEHRNKSQRRRKWRRKPDYRSHNTAERRPYEEGRHDLTALKAAADGDGGEQYLPQKRPVGRFACGERRLNNVGAGAVVCGAADDEGQRNEYDAADGSPQKGVFDCSGGYALALVHHDAEQHTHHGAQHGEYDDLDYDHDVHRHKANHKAHRHDAAEPRNGVGDERRHEAGYERRVVKNTDGDDLKRKNRRRERRSEQRRKDCAHAGQRYDAHILFVKPQKRTDAVAHASADLQRRTLSSRRAAQKVRHRSRDEDYRHEQDRQALALVDGVYDVVGALALQVAYPVQSGDENAACRQQVYEPRICLAYLRCARHGKVKGGADESAHGSHDGRKQQPAVKGAEVSARIQNFLFQLRHFPTSFVLYNHNNI